MTELANRLRDYAAEMRRNWSQDGITLWPEVAMCEEAAAELDRREAIVAAAEAWAEAERDLAQQAVQPMVRHRHDYSALEAAERTKAALLALLPSEAD